MDKVRDILNQKVREVKNFPGRRIQDKDSLRGHSIIKFSHWQNILGTLFYFFFYLIHVKGTQTSRNNGLWLMIERECQRAANPDTCAL